MPSLDLDSRRLAVEKILGYQFTDPFLCHEALQLAGFRPNSDGNRALAQIGDAVLELVLVTDGYERRQKRETINAMLQSVANLKLAEIGFAKGLDPLIYKNPSQVGAVSAKPMALTVEALLGAVFMDSGKSADAVRRVMAELGLAWPALPN